MAEDELDISRNGYGAVAIGSTHFSWIVRDQEKRQVAILVRATPENRDAASADLAEIVSMMDAAGLDPELDSYLVRMNRNPPPTVSMSWSGVVTDIERAEQLFNSFMSEIARLRQIP